MKKPNWTQILFLLLPAVALFVAAMPTAVRIYPLTPDVAENATAVSCSYFTLIEGVTGAIALPLAGLCAGITMMLAGIWLVNHKPGLVKGIVVTSIAGAVLAVVPILVKNTEILILPNVLVPVVLLVVYVMAYAVLKRNKAADEPVVGKRLK